MFAGSQRISLQKFQKQVEVNRKSGKSFSFLQIKQMKRKIAHLNPPNLLGFSQL